MENLFIVLPIFFFCLVVHEYAHGLMAEKCGDSTARYLGRLTLNPLSHIDPIGTIIFPILLIVMHSPFVFGWAKPVPINPYNFLPFLPSPSGWLCLRTFRLYCRATRSPDHLASPSRRPCRQLRLSPTDNFSRLLRSPDCVLTLIERSSLPGIPHPSHPASVSPISSPIRITNILGDTGLHS